MQSVTWHTLVTVLNQNFHKNHCKFFIFIRFDYWHKFICFTSIEIFLFAAFHRTTIPGLIRMLYSINRRVWKNCISHIPHPPRYIIDLQAHACSKFRIGLPHILALQHMPIAGFASDFHKNRSQIFVVITLATWICMLHIGNLSLQRFASHLISRSSVVCLPHISDLQFWSTFVVIRII